MIRKLGVWFSNWSMKYIPDPSIFAVLLTFIAFVAGIFVTKVSPMGMVQNWYRGLWELLTFSMQMALMVVTASAVSNAPAIKKWIQRLASIPNGSRQATYMVGLVSCIAGVIHWGLGLTVGALLAKEVGKSLRKRNVAFEYGLIAAAAYLSQMVWHGGPSASVGLLIATPGHFLEDVMGVIPMSEYMFNTMNIVITLGCIILPPLFAYLIHPRDDQIRPLAPETAAYLDADMDISEKSAQSSSDEHQSVGDKLNNSKLICLSLGLLGTIYIVHHFATKGFALDLDIVNTVFLFAGILLHGTIANYVEAVRDAVSGVSGIIFQFPLYAGIMGMVRYSGLVDVLAKGIVSISTPFTFYFWSFITASIVNIFVPSGGGQWAVQGPIAIQSALMMNANLTKTSLAVAYGNTWTNMIQPFWAIALLGITGLKARDIVGYSAAIMLLSGIIFMGGVLFLPV